MAAGSDILEATSLDETARGLLEQWQEARLECLTVFLKGPMARAAEIQDFAIVDAIAAVDDAVVSAQQAGITLDQFIAACRDKWAKAAEPVN